MTDDLAKQFPQGLDGARGLARGVGRLLGDVGYATLPEFSLRNNRRADVAGLDAKGRFMIVEIKSSTADFRADQKWPEYLEFCDAFVFRDPVTEPRAKAMLARLKHDHIDGKIRRHQNDDMHDASVLLGKFIGASPSNSERVTATALRKYAGSIGEIPEFLSP